MLRLFAALVPPDWLCDEIAQLQSGLDGAKWRKPENFHVTLRFFGEMDERRAEDLDTELTQITRPRFDLRLKGAGHFGGAEPTSLWLGAESTGNELQILAEKCERAARRSGLPPEKQRFRPHLTLAYLRPGIELPEVMAFTRGLSLFESPVFTVESFGLFSSWTGKGQSQYVLEREYLLV